MENIVGYFDNAATSYPKPSSVYDFADLTYRQCGGNAGRGASPVAKRASAVAKKTKGLIRELFHCEGKQVVFTASATDALNRILLGLDLSQSDCIYHTPFEHNAVTRPLHHIEQSRDVRVEMLSFSEDTLLPNMDMIEAQFKANKPRCVVMTHVSNVCGVVVPFTQIAKLAKLYDATVVLDMSQSAGLIDTDLSSQLVDYAVFAGHKSLMGPFGIGGFVCDKNAILNPILFGGNGVNSIEQEMPTEIVKMTEIGSQNLYAIAGLHAAIEWILSKGIDRLHAKESNNRNTLISLLSQYENITIVGTSDIAQFGGVASTIFEGYSPDEVEMILGNMGISVRAGLHCAPAAHRFLNTLPQGTIRFSVNALTCAEDFNRLESALNEIAHNS